MPVAAGPTLECVDTDQAVCDERLGLSQDEWWEQFFPVTKVRVWDGGCRQTVERVWGLFSGSSIC